MQPIMTMCIGALFPSPAVPRMIGLISLLMLPLTMLGAPVCGYIYDTSGSYDLAFGLLIALSAASLISLAFLRLPEHRT